MWHHGWSTSPPSSAERVDREVIARLPVFAWVLPGDDQANANGYIDAHCVENGEFTKPLYSADAILSLISKTSATGSQGSEG